MTYISKQQKLILLSALLVSLTLIGGVFFSLQNSGKIPGGQIAVAKILWLGFIIFFWFFAPILLLMDGTNEKFNRTVVTIHLLNVCLRAAIELFMMYSVGNWHPIYGISHDIFSLFLILIMIFFFYQRLSQFVLWFMIVLSLTFILETYFANYMLSNVSNATSPIFFVPDSAKYQGVINLTWGAIGFLCLYGIYFMQKWLKLNHD